MESPVPEDLFRSRAIAHKTLGTPSVPVISQTSYLKLQLGLWFLLSAGATYLLFITNYRETAPARGLLEPAQGVQKIVSPVAARVEEIHVHKGQSVAKGEILASLSTGFYNGQGASALEQNIEQLKADRELLIRELEVQRDALVRSQHWNRRTVENIRHSRQSLEKEIDLLTTRTQLSDRNLQAISALLQSGNASAQEYEQHYQLHLDLLVHSQTLIQRRLQQEQELDSLRNTRQLAESDGERASLQTRRELQAIDQRISNLSTQALFTVVAQQSGIVAELGLESGRSVLPNQPLFVIHPDQVELQATIYVSAAVQAKLVVGQSVLLRYDAFDYRLYGRKEGRVTSISQASLDPRENPLPISSINEPVFKVTAQLDEACIRGDSLYQLQTGTTLTADFVLWEMSLLQFIFKPILGLQGKIA
ncbi:MAG: hypothetical protein DHS20C12_01270 [Pseudohongiella sp.]|nr:MAG: hypothetical protein DHS20C12_01270 [Pseudohongiella sp.]